MGERKVRGILFALNFNLSKPISGKRSMSAVYTL